MKNRVYANALLKSESGTALLAALFIVAILTYLVIEFNYTSRVDLDIAARYRDMAEAKVIAKAGVNEAIALLREDFKKDEEEAEADDEGDEESSDKNSEKEIARVDHLGEAWAEVKVKEERARGSLSLVVYDEGSRININNLFVESGESKLDKMIKGSQKKEEKEEEEEEEEDEDEDEEDEEEKEKRLIDKKIKKRLERLIEVLDMEDVDEEEIIEAIIDWMDGDDDGDAEESYYADLEEPYAPADGPLNTIDELFLIKGITPDIFFGEGREEAEDVFDEEKVDDEAGPGLRNCLTVYGKAKLNINTAGPEVMRSYVEEDQEDLIDEIIDYRENDYFEDRADFEEAMGSGIPAKFMDATTFSSSIFRIVAEGEVNGTRARINTVVERDKDGNVEFLYWRWENI
ncbi:MAG: type II secretion system protein GspK [Candidatus Tritonobacter lacicola]|nr:type II secretion system protein GspK [Candidatus Tritonobacter lacicola]